MRPRTAALWLYLLGPAGLPAAPPTTHELAAD